MLYLTFGWIFQITCKSFSSKMWRFHIFIELFYQMAGISNSIPCGCYCLSIVVLRVGCLRCQEVGEQTTEFFKSFAWSAILVRWSTFSDITYTSRALWGRGVGPGGYPVDRGGFGVGEAIWWILYDVQGAGRGHKEKECRSICFVFVFCFAICKFFFSRET